MQLSIFSLFAAGLATLASAYTTSVGDPSGNPISRPGLNEIVPVGTPYTVTWNPTTPGTVTLVLLRGPSTNIVPLYTIAEQIPNTGAFVWTPATTLEADTTHYGIQLIVDATGQYQYTTQFGISNPSGSSSSSSSSTASATMSSSSASSTASVVTAASSTSSSVAVVSTGSATVSRNATSSSASGALYVTEVVTAYTTYCPYATSVVVNNKTYTVSSATTLTISNCPCTITHSSASSTPVAPISTATAPVLPTYVASTGAPQNSSVIQPTIPMSVPSSLQSVKATATASASSSKTSPAVAVSTGAAGRVGISIGGLVGAAFLALAL
ncbi:hypothetical protein B0A49_01831 [Cryomyces minteri]|uniref:Yeast cell wall synthesis Kre9/Knh1-like N-terminal domain-containing protein n=1 Tax=Cryomyces minteri TaxID=331657 RepID=A0A4U0XTQ0_9PEZI|nr:hypothetical protein B0A49_01831 [Cryomyces minteri]